MLSVLRSDFLSEDLDSLSFLLLSVFFSEDLLLFDGFFLPPSEAFFSWAEALPCAFEKADSSSAVSGSDSAAETFASSCVLTAEVSSAPSVLLAMGVQAARSIQADKQTAAIEYLFIIFSFLG
ncbi:MAG: hypothetical protein IKD54_06065 [Clostridia bacterium]|nr:hypothetical protein [Clostridia bacterium]